jgi:LCP family protein required for cell wall assembly
MPDGQSSIRAWPSWNRKLAIPLAGLYAFFLLLIAFLVGSILGNLAREYGQGSNFSELTTGTGFEPVAVAEATGLIDDAAVAVPSAGEEAPVLLAHLPENRINILLLGSDERSSDGEPPRTDTMLLLTLDLEGGTAGMISLARDLWLPIPGYNTTTKINTAYDLGERRGYPGGGAQLAKDTVSSFIGQPVQYYAQVDFGGFVRFIDEIDGVTVNVRQTIHDPKYPTPDFGYETFHLDAGPQLLDGEKALKYARTRNLDNDYGRAARQQELILAVVDKIMAADMIPVLIGKAPQLWSALQSSFSTDMPLAEVIDIAGYVRSNPLEVRQVVLDNRYGEESWSENGAWILLPDRQRIRPMLREFFDTTARTTAEGEHSPTARPPLPRAAEIRSADALIADRPVAVRVLDASEARVEILNGTGAPGIAARVRAELQAQGWQVVAIGDADRGDYLHTLLVNYNTDENVLKEIGRQLNLSASLDTLPGLLMPDSTDLRIVIGRDYLTTIPNENR